MNLPFVVVCLLSATVRAQTVPPPAPPLKPPQAPANPNAPEMNTRDETAPAFQSHVTLVMVPVVVLCLTFAALYALIPNTKVRWGAALVDGLAGGILFHLNDVMSVLYVSRVVSNSRIYGSLGLVPVFMIGLYFSWLILLFGAQVAYAYQNRATYFEEKQIE